MTGSLGQYDVRSIADLEQKMLQLPRGTVLVWGTNPDDVEAAILARLQVWADQQGVTLQRPVAELGSE